MKSDEAPSESFSTHQVENETQFQLCGASRRPVEPTFNDDLLRCGCGALLARWVAAGLELKCRRCKCMTLIPYPKRSPITRRRPVRT